VQIDSKLLSVFSWPVIFKSKVTNETACGICKRKRKSCICFRMNSTECYTTSTCVPFTARKIQFPSKCSPAFAVQLDFIVATIPGVRSTREVTMSLTYPRRKKPSDVISSERGIHGVVPSRPTQIPGKWISRNSHIP
jgi:hypothetical protein